MSEPDDACSTASADLEHLSRVDLVSEVGVSELRWKVDRCRKGVLLLYAGMLQCHSVQILKTRIFKTIHISLHTP